MRRFYARLVTDGVPDPRILEAFATIRREDFMGPGPWKIRVDDGYLDTDTDDPIVLYQDVLVALSADRGIHNGQPSLHAKCLGTVLPQLGERVIHVGAGTGYYTAILAYLVGRAGTVHAYEIESDLAQRAKENLATLAEVTVHGRSALEQPLPEADVLYVCAGVTSIPSVWLDALAVRGRLALPLAPKERLGCMLLVTRHSASVYAARIFAPAAFISCIGAHDNAESKALASTLDTRSTSEVRSLRRDNRPDESAWFIGTGWWLSTREPSDNPIASA